MKRVWHWVAAKRPLELACCGACSVEAPGVDVHKYAGHPGELRDVRAAASRFQCPMPNALISESLTAVIPQQSSGLDPVPSAYYITFKGAGKRFL